ncbi:hypothetical protein F2P81_019107 [Scophthalmus maximus]|uniref:Uncharacterized protein n=1 Tax=Scophthalmus maximus TaxID=52904 RepID=A0A6A4S8W0_SCOMX|nr:hypothetical protein F2P81_019107 [Scophthalmus maximus]
MKRKSGHNKRKFTNQQDNFANDYGCFVQHTCKAMSSHKHIKTGYNKPDVLMLCVSEYGTVNSTVGAGMAIVQWCIGTELNEGSTELNGTEEVTCMTVMEKEHEDGA